MCYLQKFSAYQGMPHLQYYPDFDETFGTSMELWYNLMFQHTLLTTTDKSLSAYWPREVSILMNDL
jgi:hypothetical protein